MTYEKLARTLDQVLADNVRLKGERDEALAVIHQAIQVIKDWHNMDGAANVWQIYYDHSPEMLPIRALLDRLT